MTKISVVFVLTIFSQIVFSQTIWQDNFSDSNFTTNPIWTGNSTDFEVDSEKKLHLNAAPVSATSYLGTPSTAGINSVWQFNLELAFNPSSNNYAEIHFMSSSVDPNQASTGYFVRVGGSTSDKVSLFRKDGNSSQLLAESSDGYVNSSQVNLTIKIARDSINQWSVYGDSTGGTNFKLLANTTDGQYLNSSYFSIKCMYTSTRSDKFFFDDIFVVGEKFQDLNPPKIADARFSDRNKLKLQFSEPLDSATASSTSNYQLQSSFNLVTAAKWQSGKPTQVELSFKTDFANDEPVGLFIEKVEDPFGNEIIDTTLYLTFFRPAYKSVVINEIMADPSPSVGLPEVEYIEIFNPTNRIIEMDLWKLAAESDTFLLPFFQLQPNGYGLICSTTNSSEYDTLNPLLIEAGSSWIKNTEEQLVLLDENNEVIDAIHYTSNLYLNEAKKEGGWSLEQIVDSLSCFSAKNWSASNSTLGGTPGFTNNPEMAFTYENNSLKNVQWVNDYQVKLNFTGGIDPMYLPQISGSAPVDSVWFDPIQPTGFSILFGNQISTNPVTVTVEESKSCTGNFVSETITFSTPHDPIAGKIVLNELMFNPDVGGAEYIELWNISDETFVLSNLRFVKLDKDGLPQQSYILSTDSILFPPKQIIAFTENQSVLKMAHELESPIHYFECLEFPSLANDEGIIALTDAQLTILEDVHYSEDWHHSSISNTKGVSLERVNPTINSTEESAWHSAASSANYATPGNINSQFSAGSATEKMVWLEKSTVSPNNDGLNDLLYIHYNLPMGAIITVSIFNAQGNPVYTLRENYLTDKIGQLVWDGTTDRNTIATTGVYIILVEWFTPSGETGTAKLNCVVSR